MILWELGADEICVKKTGTNGECKVYRLTYIMMMKYKHEVSIFFRKAIL
jgi:hypothetical protein